jgi:inhibitor of cysteine peptidase
MRLCAPAAFIASRQLQLSSVRCILMDAPRNKRIAILTEQKETPMQRSRSLCWIHSSPWLLLVALLAVAYHPHSARAETKVITDADKASEVHLKVGDTLEVRLKSNPSTGYVWYVRKESTPLLKLDHQSTTEPADSAPGRPIVQVFTFQPRHAGNGTLLLHYIRSWENPDPNEVRFTVRIVVE